MSSIVDQLAELGGANPTVIESAPRFRSSYAQMGLILLGTAIMATVSMAFALLYGAHILPLLAIPFALFWGLLIFTVDRYLVTQMTNHSTKWGIIGMATPRVLMAIILGAVISTPLVLRIFEPEIAVERLVIQQEMAQQYGDGEQATLLETQRTELEAEISTLNDIIAGNMTVADNPLVAQAKETLDATNTTYVTSQEVTRVKYNTMVCEERGIECENADRTSGKAGAGEQYRRAKTAYEQALTQEQHALTARDTAQTAYDEAVAKAKQDYDIVVTAAQEEAAERLPEAQEELAAVNLNIAANRAVFDQTNTSSGGILLSLEALHRLSQDRRFILIAHLLLGALFMMIELLPVISKTLAKFGGRTTYDQTLEKYDNAMLGRVDIQLQLRESAAENVERDLREREEQLGMKANEFVATKMDEILQVALTDWAQRMTSALRTTPPTPPNQSIPQHSPGIPPGVAQGATAVPGKRRRRRWVRNPLGLPPSSNI
ncbi:MAG: DUF4407 domain-containing protein [Actinomycetales bacterium]